MSRSLRKIGRNQEALKALALLGKEIPKMQGGIKGLLEALPRAAEPSDAKIIAALVDDVQALAVEQEVQRETFIRLLIALSEDSEENIRKVEGTIRETLIKEREGT